MNKKLLIAMLGATAMAMSAGAMAQQKTQDHTGWYIGADIGTTDLDGADDDTGTRFLGGYNINRNFAAELGYSMLYDKGGVEVTAWELVGIGKFPLGNHFSVFGKLGFAMWEAEVERAPFGNFKDDGTDLTFGLGVQYDFSRNFGVRGQWQTYDVGDGDADVLSLGIISRF
jgi:OmpA-OmpF porin, OOP family